jgi:Uri superfamily endonuclease
MIELPQSLPDNTGCYRLILFHERPGHIKIGSSINADFPKGYYVYTGSHQRYLLQRVKRHLRQNKKLHWHIDYLTTHPDFEIQEVILLPGRSDECSINRENVRSPGARFFGAGFGTGDCREGCPSHLVYLGRTRPKHL